MERRYEVPEETGGTLGERDGVVAVDIAVRPNRPKIDDTGHFALFRSLVGDKRHDMRLTRAAPPEDDPVVGIE